MDGREFYNTHAKDCEEWGLPPLPHWESLTPEQRREWEEQADEFVQKLLADRKERTTA